MSGPPGTGSTAGLSGPQFLVTYANGIIANNAQFPVAVARFQQLLTGLNYNTASLNDIAVLWNQAVAYQDAQAAAGFKQPTYTPTTIAPPPGQFQLNQPGVPYTTQTAPPGTAPADLSAIYAAIVAAGAKNPSLDPAILAGYVAQIEQAHQQQQQALTAQFAASLAAVVQSDVQDHQAFLGKLSQIANASPGATPPPPNIDLSSLATQIAAIVAQPASAAQQTTIDFYNKYGDRIRAIADQFGFDPATYITQQITKQIAESTAAGAGQGTNQTPEQKDTWANLGDFLLIAATLLGKIIDFTNSPESGIDTGTNAVTDAIKNPIQDSIEKQKAGLDKIFNKFRAGGYETWQAVIDDFTAIGGAGSLLQSLLNVGILLTFPIRAILAGGEPIATELRQLAQAEHPVQLLDPMTLMSSVRRENQDIKWVADRLAKHGLDSESIELLYKLSDVKPDLSLLYELRRRGEINDLTFGNLLSELGYDPDNLDLVGRLVQQQLQPQDIVRLADKHIFSRDIPQIFGQYTEFDSEFTDRMSKHGYSEDDVLKLWAAHWELPSPQLVFEMLHRGEINEQQMDVYFKLTDWLPFFRDKLKNISYTTLTRVDIRRMYKAGVINDQQMHRSHLDIGYNEQNARLLDDFVKRTSRTDDNAYINKLEAKAETAIESAYVHGRISHDDARNRLIELGLPANVADTALHVLDLERAESVQTHKLKDHTSSAIAAVISAYSRGSLARSDAHSFLLALGYTEVDAEHELLILELQRDIKQKERFIEHAEALYVGHMIDFATLTGMLESEGFQGDEISRISTDLVERRQYRNKRPTEAQVVKWFKSAIIDQEQLADELRGVGYSDKHIGYFMLELAGKPLQ